MGMELTGKLNRDGVQVIKDYAGPGKDRVVFRKTLTQADAAYKTVSPDRGPVAGLRERARPRLGPRGVTAGR